MDTTMTITVPNIPVLLLQQFSVVHHSHLFECVQSVLSAFQVMLQLSDSHQLDSVDRMGIREVLSLEGRGKEKIYIV